MNSKQLERRIMDGISKAINEGFRAWREENTPKFDVNTFNKNCSRLVDILMDLFKEKEVLSINFRDAEQDKSFGYVSEKDYDNIQNKETEALTSVIIGRIVKSAESMFGEDFAEKMKDSALDFEPNHKKSLQKYIESEIDPGAIKTVKGCKYISVVQLRKAGMDGVPYNAFKCTIKFGDILDHIDEIIAWFE